MKKTALCPILTLILALLVPAAYGQGISYQAVARDAGGELQANENINVRFYILQGSAGGTEVYRETHAVMTNAYALFSVIIGKGTPESGVFNDVDWGTDDHFLKVEVNGSDMGTTQLETVPYSKVATAMNIDHLTDVSIGTVVVDDVLKWDGSSWVNAPDAVDDADADPTNEIQTLSVVGSNLQLSNGGGSVPFSTSPWTENGTTVYYDSGNVGIGTTNPTDPFQVISSAATGRITRMENSGIGTGADVLEIRVQAGAPDGGQFIEMERGGTIEATINTDGSAEFLNVTVEEDLTSTATPVTGRVYANGLPIAYGYITSGGGISTDYGISSVTNSATGVYLITLNKSITGNPVIIATSYNSGPNDEIIAANQAANANQIEINIANGSGTAVNSNFYFVVFGNAQ